MCTKLHKLTTVKKTTQHVAVQIKTSPRLARMSASHNPHEAMFLSYAAYDLSSV